MDYKRINFLTSSIAKEAPYIVTLQGRILSDCPFEDDADVTLKIQYGILKAKCWWAFSGLKKTPNENLADKKYIDIPAELMEYVVEKA